MTIKEFLIRNELNIQKDRLEKLVESDAPSIMTEKVAQYIVALEEGVFKCDGDNDLLELEAIDMTMESRYLAFNGQSVLYFPTAQYGKYITLATK